MPPRKHARGPSAGSRRARLCMSGVRAGELSHLDRAAFLDALELPQRRTDDAESDSAVQTGRRGPEHIENSV